MIGSGEIFISFASGDVRDRECRPDHLLGDRAADRAHRDPFLCLIGNRADTRRLRQGHNLGHFIRRLVRGAAPLPVCGGDHVLARHASLFACAAHSIDVDAEVARKLAHRRCRERARRLLGLF
jgi:hypothetical protein